MRFREGFLVLCGWVFKIGGLLAFGRRLKSVLEGWLERA